MRLDALQSYNKSANPPTAPSPSPARTAEQRGNSRATQCFRDGGDADPPMLGAVKRRYPYLVTELLYLYHRRQIIQGVKRRMRDFCTTGCVSCRNSRYVYSILRGKLRSMRASPPRQPRDGKRHRNNRPLAYSADTLRFCVVLRSTLFLPAVPALYPLWASHPLMARLL